MDDWEMRACAVEMRRQHGKDAPVEAARRAGALLEADDHDGYGVWLQVLTYICKLGPITEFDVTRH